MTERLATALSGRYTRSADTLAVGRDAFHLFAMSPDGRRLAAVVDGLQAQELRIYDLRSGEHQLWVRRPVIHQPVWSPLGEALLPTEVAA